MSKRRTFTDYEKQTVYHRYNGCCGICGIPLSREKMTISHKVPLSRGGTNGMDNLILVCWSCNQAKSNLTMDEFLDKISEILRNQEAIK